MSRQGKKIAAPKPISMQEEVADFKRKKIMETALSLFYDQGYSGTTIDAIADALGRTKPFIYQYFPNKVKILEELCLPIMTGVNKALKDALELQDSPTNKLLHAVKHTTQHTLNNQRNTAVFFREQQYMTKEFLIEVDSLRKSFDENLKIILDQGVKCGEFKVDNISLFGLSITGMINWTFVWYNPKGPMTCEEISDHIAHHCLQLVERERS